MAQRKHSRRRFGSPESVHSSKGENAAATAVVAASKAVQEARVGDCQSAVKSLLSAAGWVGHVVAHSGSGGSGIPIGTSISLVDRARSEVLASCVVKSRKRKGRR